jgi:hypothetical protein
LSAAAARTVVVGAPYKWRMPQRRLHAQVAASGGLWRKATTILVIGATGLNGRELVRRLSE